MGRALVLLALVSTALAAEQISGQDIRNTSEPDMNTHFQMPEFASRTEWLGKAAFLRKQILAKHTVPVVPSINFNADDEGELDEDDEIVPVEKPSGRKK